MLTHRALSLSLFLSRNAHKRDIFIEDYVEDPA
jgi:hypothetical protein